jgi:dienelactone hydrolase
MRTATIFSLFVLSVLTVSAASAAVQSKSVSYKDGETPLTGHVFWDDAIEGKRPGVLVVHEWWGLNDYAKKRAEMLAEMGYVAFAVDMYGGDKVTTHPAQAKEWSSATTENVDAWRQRAVKGLEQLRANPMVDPNRIAAIGYCFGGATVMQLAYAGTSLPLPANAEEAARIKGAVLIEHGNDDAFIPAERVAAFKAAMADAGVRLTFHGYDGARHGFTNPDAGSFGIDNLQYDQAADEASWKSMQVLFEEIF